MYMRIYLLPREIMIIAMPQERNFFLPINWCNDINGGFDFT